MFFFLNRVIDFVLNTDLIKCAYLMFSKVSSDELCNTSLINGICGAHVFFEICLLKQIVQKKCSDEFSSYFKCG